MSKDFFSENIGYEPEVDFDKPEVIIVNGNPKMINEIEAIRQWILKFSITPKDTYEIYEGTGFGNRIKSLFGKKRVGYGYEEAELERDYREGMLLNPAINQVTYFNLKKQGRNLDIFLSLELYNSEILDVSIEKAYVIKG